MENPNFPGKLSRVRRLRLTHHLGGPHSPENSNLICAVEADPAERATEDDDGRGLLRGVAFGLPPALALWALIVWLAGRFWPF